MPQKAAIKVIVVKNCKIFFIFPTIFAIFDDFSKLCSTFGTLYIEKSSNTVESLEKMKKNLSIILLLKWPLLDPKMFIVRCGIIKRTCDVS